MMNNVRTTYLLVFFVCFIPACNQAQPGCTDPLALNYDPAATEDNMSCEYQIATVNPEWSKELGQQVAETSGLIFLDGVLWTHNDDTDTRLYLLDTAKAEIQGDIVLPGVENIDWEEIAQDQNFIYVGDFGNNGGDRENLRILRVEKSSLSSATPSIDTIWFTYSDQLSYVSPGLNQTEFDCEAFIVSSDSMYLFTKQWLSGNTTLYVLPKLPGTYVARKKVSFDTQGQVTGATYLEDERLLVLCGYAGLIQPFVYLFYDFPGDDFFSGTNERIHVALPFHQVEAITTSDGIHYFLSNEKVQQSYVNIPQKLHKIDLSGFLSEYLEVR